MYIQKKFYAAMRVVNQEDDMKWSHKALKWKTSVDNQRPLSLIRQSNLILFCSCWYFCNLFSLLLQILNVHLRFKYPFRQIQNSVLKFNYAQCVILFAQSHVLFIQLSRNFASLFHRIVSSRAFLGSLILIYFIIY